MATVSSKVSDSQCRQFPVGGWHSEGSDGLSLKFQQKTEISVKKSVFWTDGSPEFLSFSVSLLFTVSESNKYKNKM